jgi:ACS family hexuronate transporter-like MFS transporter
MVSDTKDEQVLAGPRKWFILLLAVGSYLMGFVVRFTWPPIIAVAAPELGIDMTQAGLYMSGFYIGYVIIHIPAGILADRFGVRYILAFALLLEGASSLGMAHIHSFGPGFVLRILTGLGAGTVYGASVRTVTTWFSAKERGLAFGLLMLSPTAGVLVSNQLALFALKYFSWQFIFTMAGATACLLGVIVSIFMKDKVSEVKSRSFMEGLRFSLANKNIMRMAFAGFCLIWIQIGFISWGNTAMKNGGLSLASAGLAMTLFGAGGIVGPLVSGYLADHSGARKKLIISGFLLLIPMVLVFGRLHSVVALSTMACALGFVFGFINTLLPLIISDYSGAKWSASAGGVTGCIFQVGAVLGPAVLGFSVDLTGSFSTVWWMLAAAPAAGLLSLSQLSSPDGEGSP